MLSFGERRNHRIMKIFFVNGVRRGEELELAVPEITVGRETDNILEIPTEGVSRYHGRFRRGDAGVWMVEDTGSTNGIKVNGKKISGAQMLEEGDLVEFGDQMLRVTGLAENAPKVVFCTMGEESPAVEQAEAGRPEAVAASAAAPTPPGNVSEAPDADTIAVKDWSEAVRSGSVKLFGGGSSREKSVEGKPKRLLSNRLYYTLLFALVISGICWFYQMKEARGVRGPETASRGTDPKDFLLYYEKELVAPDNVFRFVLHVENGAAEFVIDDLKSQRRFQRRIETLNEASLESLRASVERSGIMTESSPPPGDVSSTEREQRRLVVGDAGKMAEVVVLNNLAPKSFEDVEYAINILADNYGLQTIAMTPEELREQAEQSFIKAEDLFANREARLSNLRAAIQRYAVTVSYLEQFSPKPALWDKARKRLDEAVKLRERKLQELNYERIRLAEFKEFEQLRYVFHQIMELADPDSREYDNARRLLIKLDNYLNRMGGR